MFKKRLSKSLRKFIRQEKARIRRQASGTEEAEEKIRQLVEEYYRQYNKVKIKE
jgi:hypothetical protein